MSHDLGIRIRRLALALTHEQLATMLAIKQTGLEVRECLPILASHYHTETYGPLVRTGLIGWECGPPGRDREWARPSITPLGEKVFLDRIEIELSRAGVLPQRDPPECAA